jgi:hypothetical protein
VSDIHHSSVFLDPYSDKYYFLSAFLNYLRSVLTVHLSFRQLQISTKITMYNYVLSFVIQEDEMLLPQAMDKVETSDLQQHNKSDGQSEVFSGSKMTASSIVDSHSQTALQNSIETGAVSLEPVRTEHNKTHGDSVMGGDSASDGKKNVEEGKVKMEEDSERGNAGSETSKRKAQMDAGAVHKKKKTSLSGGISIIKISLNACVSFKPKSHNLVSDIC